MEGIILYTFMMVIGYFGGKYFWKYKGAIRNDYGEIIGHMYNKSNDRFLALVLFATVPISLYILLFKI